jgi:hypothetical protein
MVLVLLRFSGGAPGFSTRIRTAIDLQTTALRAML